MSLTDSNNSLFTRRCFDLARLGISGVKTNPMVGAMIVKGNKIISEGYHENFGGPHAEVNAIAGASHINLEDTLLCVSLEPCSHFGKTPPCADLILKQGIKRCLVSNIDPNPLVKGAGIAKLQAGSVDVAEGVNRKLGCEILRRFIVQQKLHRPYIILKWAQSRDAFMGIEGKKVKISHPLTDRLVHKWRAETDGIMVGSKTVLVDNPHLGNRLFYGPNPLRILLDRGLRAPETAQIFDEDIPTIRISTSSNIRQQGNVVTSMNVQGESEPLQEIFNRLYQMNIGSVLIEGGPTLLNHCLRLDLWDEARVITSPLLIKEGIRAPAFNEIPVATTLIGRDEVALFLNSGSTIC